MEKQNLKKYCFWIRFCTKILLGKAYFPLSKTEPSDSAIELHLSQNPACAKHHNNSRFSILAQSRSPFHLYALIITKPSAGKKSSCTAERWCTNGALSLVFFQPIMAELFPINSCFFSSALQSDNSFNKSQTKSCFEDINILIKAFLKFCTTNQLFVQDYF